MPATYGSGTQNSGLTASNAVRWLSSFWGWQLFRSWTGLLVFWIVAGALCFLRCFTGLYGVTCFAHDGPMVLDGAWRMLWGQHPHSDFNSMIGPIAYLPTAVAMVLSHHAAASLAYGEALLGGVLALWAFALGSGMRDVPRALYTLTVLAYTISPGELGLSPFLLTAAVSYNRASYGFLALVLLECLRPRKRFDFLGGFSTGTILVLLLFLKLTGIFVGTMLVAALFWMKPQTRQRWLGILAGFGAMLVAFAIYYHFHFGPVIRDMLLTIGAKHVHVTQLYTYDDLVLEGGLGVLFALGLSWIVSREDAGGTQRRPWALAALAVAVINGLNVTANWQQAELPLLTLFLIAGADVLLRVRASTTEGAFPKNLTLNGMGLFAAIPLLALLVSLGTGMYSRLFALRRTTRMAAPTLATFVPMGDEVVYTYFINSGLNLLKANYRPGERIMSLDFSNPFSLAFEAEPAPGGSTNLQFGGSFDEKHFVPPERLIGTAELVMLPTAYSDGTLWEKVPQMYGPYLHAHYHLVGESWRWELYRRN